ncbi:MAG: hypothetical protein KKB20_16080 [Proteobacteria bacterium]|nr:hypothetical protein [Pseudomonadota bacterium]
MAKKITILAVLILSLALAGSALAQSGDQSRRGSDSAARRAGHKAGQGPMAAFHQDPEVAKLREDISRKQQELAAAFSVDRVDETKARSVHREISTLKTELADKRMEYTLAFKKRNPDWTPRFVSGGGRRHGRAGAGEPGQGFRSGQQRRGSGWRSGQEVESGSN